MLWGPSHWGSDIIKDCNSENVKKVHESFVMLMWHLHFSLHKCMSWSMVAKTLWSKQTKVESRMYWNFFFKSLLKTHEWKYNCILHVGSLWYKDSISYQPISYGVLGPSPAKSTFDKLHYDKLSNKSSMSD